MPWVVHPLGYLILASIRGNGDAQPVLIFHDKRVQKTWSSRAIFCKQVYCPRIPERSGHLEYLDCRRPVQISRHSFKREKHPALFAAIKNINGLIPNYDVSRTSYCQFSTILTSYMRQFVTTRLRYSKSCSTRLDNYGIYRAPHQF